MLNQSHSIRFKRFAHKAYAAFASMHREITIGRVSRSICDLELLKAGRAVTICGVAMISSLAYADDSSRGLTSEELTQQLSLQEVLVQATKTEATARSYRSVATVEATDIQALPVTAVADMLTYLPGLDVRTRGANGAQADVGLRGGTFDQVRVLLNGIDLSDAHTGHYALNLPITQALVQRIEVLDGAINIITVSPESKGVHAAGRLTAGMNGLVNPELALFAKNNGWRFSSSAEYNRSDGAYVPHPSEKEQTAAENSDYRIANLFFRAQGVVDIQTGAQYKDAGAGMFYGFGSQTQRDRTCTGFASISYNHRWGLWSLDTRAVYRANADYYQWWRSEPTKGANKHLSQHAAAEIAGHYVSRLGTTTLGLEARYDHIFSTNLGDSAVRPIHLGERELPLSSGHGDIHYYASQTFHYRILNAAIHADGHYNTKFGSYFGGNANIGVDYAGTGRAYLNISHSNRLPTFTDLYYNAGKQLGSRELKPEAMTTFALGTAYTYYPKSNNSSNSSHSLTLQGDVFYRLGKNIIDWVKVDDDQVRPYHATNQNTVNTIGCEAIATYRLNEWLPCVRLSYAYTWMDLDLEKTGSRYLDYLSHKLTAHIDHAFYVHSGTFPWTLGGTWTLTYRVRKGEYETAEGTTEHFGPNLLLDGSLYWRSDVVRVSADVTNMTNRHYYDYGGILQPGILPRITVQFDI